MSDLYFDEKLKKLNKDISKPILFTNLNYMVIIVNTHLGFEFFEFLY